MLPKRLFYPSPPGVWLVTRPAGGGGAKPPKISQITGPISKFQTPLDSLVRELPDQDQNTWPGGEWWRHWSCQSQNVWLFGIDELGEQKIDVKREQSQLIGMYNITDICKYHFLCFVTIICTGQGHLRSPGKKGQTKKFGI